MAGGALLALGGLFIFWKNLYACFLLLAVCLLALIEPKYRRGRRCESCAGVSYINIAGMIVVILP